MLAQGGLGNNNFYVTDHRIHKNGGYYSQFGIFDASHESITVQVKNPEIRPGQYLDLNQSPIWKNLHTSLKGQGLTPIVGECRSNKKWGLSQAG